jgi:hypothetical protein
MRAAPDVLSAAEDRVAVVEAPKALEAIRRPGCAAAIWRREATSFQGWLDGLAPEALPRGRVILRPDAAREAARHLCEAAGTPHGADRERLCDDVAALADLFAGLTRARHLRLRLDAVNGDSCRRFHVDAIRARLVCTHRGPGTQYGVSEGGAPPGRVLSVPTGAPIVLRGTLWPAEKPAGLLHRSPPITGTGTTRLVLVLDAVDDPEEEA